MDAKATIRPRSAAAVAQLLSVLAAMDFFTEPTATFRVLYVFFLIHHARRTVLHVRVADDKWFSFDRLEFETDAATLKPASRAQLMNIVEILKCYPNVDLKIGGYTDSTADDAYNLQLSKERASNTMNELIAMGVAPTRLTAEGYGEQFPVASNDTEEGRQRNRRIDLRVTKK